MNAIEEIMQLEAAKWIGAKIAELPDRARYRAYSAIRSLQWASRNFHFDMPIPAAYFALHATEEAVAAFVSSAKACGYGEDAKAINLKDHLAKATVSLLAQKLSNFLADFKPGIAVEPAKDLLLVRFTVDEVMRVQEASTSLFHFTNGPDTERKPDFLDEVVGSFGDIQALMQEVKRGQEVRNEIFYATGAGLPSGFLDPEASLRRECGLTLGLIWAAIDINRNQAEPIAFIAQALRTANRVIDEVRSQRTAD